MSNNLNIQYLNKSQSGRFLSNLLISFLSEQSDLQEVQDILKMSRIHSEIKQNDQTNRNEVQKISTFRRILPQVRLILSSTPQNHLIDIWMAQFYCGIVFGSIGEKFDCIQFGRGSFNSSNCNSVIDRIECEFESG